MTVLTLDESLSGIDDNRARAIAYLYEQWEMDRQGWLAECDEAIRYVYATDTTTTTAGGWKNNTHLPKLCQIVDNLHSNYLSTSLPNENWLRWLGEGEEAQQKAKMIQAYMRHMAHQSNYRVFASEIFMDYILYGCCFATAEHRREAYDLPNGQEVVVHDGPVPVRISPRDIVFDLKARSFRDSPKIIRSAITMGDLAKRAKEDEELWGPAFEKAKKRRTVAGGYSRAEWDKQRERQAQGFNSSYEFATSHTVEVLTFRGDWYDEENYELHENQEIIIIDRCIEVYAGTTQSWVGKDDIAMAVWRRRPENLYGMSPIANLIGMQYRIDHLENLKADAQDLSVHPVLAIRGAFEPFKWGPETVIKLLDDNATISEIGVGLQGVINANNEIAELERKMEEISGAPKQALGIRTPGEKTKFEVQTLDNATARLYLEKVTNVESQVFEKVLNNMFAIGRDKLREPKTLNIFNEEFGVDEFLTIGPDDIAGFGRVRPVGARYFGEQAQLIQEITQLANTSIWQDIRPHWSRLQTAKVIEDALNLGRFELVAKNRGLAEDAELQDTMRQLQQTLQERAAAEARPDPDQPLPTQMNVPAGGNPPV